MAEDREYTIRKKERYLKSYIANGIHLIKLIILRIKHNMEKRKEYLKSYIALNLIKLIILRIKRCTKYKKEWKKEGKEYLKLNIVY